MGRFAGRVVLGVFTLLLVRADAWSSARRPDLGTIRAAEQVDAVTLDEPIRIVFDEPAQERAQPATDMYVRRRH